MSLQQLSTWAHLQNIELLVAIHQVLHTLFICAQYEGGVEVTATAIVGIFELSKKAAVTPALTHVRATF